MLMKPAGLQITSQQSRLKSGFGTGDNRQRGEVKIGEQCGFENILVSRGLKSTSESMEASSEE